MLANSWSNARRVRSGSTDCVWATNQRINCMRMIIIASNADQNCILTSSSTSTTFATCCRTNGKHSRKRSRRPRQSSTNSHLNPTSATSRVSRSHSPSTLLKQPSKRRNTMNSRDAAFDESLKEIIEATAAEAAAQHDNVSVTSTGNHDLNGSLALDEDGERASGSRKKRKRSEDDG